MAIDPKATPGGQDPSMDDILASIRRILDEESPKEDPARDEPMQAAAQAKPASRPTAPAVAETETDDEDVFDLDPSMMVSESDASLQSEPEPEPAPLAEPEPANMEDIDPMDEYDAVAEPDEPKGKPSLVAPEAAAAASASVGALLRTLASERSTATHRGGPTIEDLVREELRPMLKAWLDAYLPPLVERLVQAEIERVMSRNG